MKKQIFGIDPYEAKKNEEYMNPAQKDHFKKILNNWRTTLINSIDATYTNMKMDENHYPDPNDRASKEEEFTMELRTRDRERKLLKKIESTLESIAKNQYGFCKVCDADIGVRRLEARPVADLCVDCKTVLEKKEN